MSWAKQRLKELLPGVEATLAPSTSGRSSNNDSSNKGKKIRVASVSSVEGDAYQSTRKGGKKVSCYDLKLELSWVAFDDDDAGCSEEGDEGDGGDGDGAAGEEGEGKQGGDGEDGSTEKKKKKEDKKRTSEIKGDLKVLEIVTGHDEDDIIFEATTSAGSRGALSPREAADALRKPLLGAIAAFVSELEALEL